MPMPASPSGPTPVPVQELQIVLQAMRMVADEDGYVLASLDHVRQRAQNLPPDVSSILNHVTHLVKLGYIAEHSADNAWDNKLYQILFKEFDVNACEEYMHSFEPNERRIAEINTEIWGLRDQALAIQRRIKELTAERDGLAG
jgi:hypothetical protein